MVQQGEESPSIGFIMYKHLASRREGTDTVANGLVTMNYGFRHVAL